MNMIACASCKYFAQPTEADRGECRYYPPVVLVVGTIIAAGQNNIRGQFPIVAATDWCGFHRHSGEGVASRADLGGNRV
jgi:hypothetical protein